jgi:hypothetical protein
VFDRVLASSCRGHVQGLFVDLLGGERLGVRVNDIADDTQSLCRSAVTPYVSMKILVVHVGVAADGRRERELGERTGREYG